MILSDQRAVTHSTHRTPKPPYTPLNNLHGWIATLSPPGDRSIQISLIASDPTAPVNPAVSIEVDDVDDAYQIARENGWEIVHDLAVEEWGVRRFFFRDADGNVMNVLSHL